MTPVRAILLFAALLAFHCAGNWALPLLDRDEPRFAEASREMLQRRDFVVPHLNGRERFDKPPLIYWAQAGSYKVFGENEFAARFPSALFAALTALVIALWGSRAINPEAGLRAALIFSLSLQTIAHARAAVADMPMICCVALAAWCGWEWLNGTVRSEKLEVVRSARVPCLFRLTTAYWSLAACWLAMALGFLAKGPIALLPAGMLAWMAFQKPRANRPPAWQWLAGAALMTGVVALWGVPALLRTHGEYARIGLGRHVVARSFDVMEGHGASSLPGYFASLPFYFLTVWISFLPWAFWLPAAVRHYWRQRPARGSLEAFLLCGVVLTFGIFTIVRTKLPHYTLPAFPFLALLLAKWWGETARSARTFRRTAAIAACGTLAFAVIGFSLVARFSASEQIYKAASPFLARDMECAISGYEEPSLVWAFRRRLAAFLTPVAAGELAAWMAQPGPRLCILPDENVDTVLPSRDAGWKVVHAAGWQIAKGRRVRLCAVIKQR